MLEKESVLLATRQKEALQQHTRVEELRSKLEKLRAQRDQLRAKVKTTVVRTLIFMGLLLSKVKLLKLNYSICLSDHSFTH